MGYKSYTLGFSGAAACPPCMKNASLFWYSDIWGLSDRGGPAPALANQFLRRVLTRENAFHTETNPAGPLTPLPPLWGSHTLGPKCLALTASGPGPENPGQPLHPRACSDYSRQPVRGRLTLRCPFLLTETTVKAPAHVLPLTPSAPDRPWCGGASSWGPCPVWRPLLLGSTGDKLCFPLQSSPDVLASPCLNNTKALYLKHSLSWFS